MTDKMNKRKIEKKERKHNKVNASIGRVMLLEVDAVPN